MSTEYRECRVCHTQRDRSTLVHGVCPFCSDATNVVEEPQKKTRQKRSTRVKPAETPQQNPSESPTTPADPSVGTYTAPAFDSSAAEAHPQAELAARELARRRLMHFIKRFRPKYLAGWVHEDICRRLERFLQAVEAGLSPRLLILCPPRLGKSEIGSRHFIPWVLGQHPDWEIIAASHTASLTLSFSRYIRDLLRDPAYQVLFENCRLDPSSQSTENWNLTYGGGYLAAGVGSGITGRGCFISSTLIHSDRGLIEIGALVQLHRSGRPIKVLAYNHASQRPEYRNVIATHEETTVELVRITLADGATVCCTPNHEVFVEGRGYAPAEVLRGGETVFISENLPGMRGGEVPGEQGVPRVLSENSPQRSRTALCEMRRGFQSLARRGGEVVAARTQRSLLLKGLQRGSSCGEECEALPGMWKAGYESWSNQRRNVLQSGVPGCDEAETCRRENHLLGLFKRVCEKARRASVLFKAVLRFSTCAPDAWFKQSKFQGWRELPNHLYQNAGAYFEAGQRCVRGLCEQAGSASASHRRSEDERRAGESSGPVQYMPHSSPQIKRGAVALVERIRSEPISVYDLQVEEFSNYFANSVLVHNCHILSIDDVVKDMESADSQTIRDNIWEWYCSTAYTRLAPGGGVLGILTHWHEEDWAGKIIQAMETGDGDTFEIVRYPAINEHGDEYLLPDDRIVQLAPLEPVPEGARLTRLQGTALHPARYDTEAVTRIKRNLYASGQQRVWSALYQQSPAPDEGLFFTKDMFRYYGSAPPRDDLYVYQAWDFAISTGKESDYTVGVTIGQDHRDNLYVLDVRRFRSDNSLIIVDQLIEYAREHDAALVGFEDGQIWKTLEAQYLKRCDELRYYPSFEVLKPLTDKMVRASPLRGRMQLGKVYFDEKAPWFRDLFFEFTRFPAGKHDDIIDATAWCVRLTLTRAAPKQKDTQPKTKSWKDKLSLYTGQTGGSHMSA